MKWSQFFAILCAIWLSPHVGETTGLAVGFIMLALQIYTIIKGE